MASRRIEFNLSEDLYSGYNDYNTAYNTKDIEQDVYLQEALRTSYGSRSGMKTGRKTPGYAMRPGTLTGRERTSSVLRPVTASRDPNRPVTAVKGAGYTSSQKTFDPLNQAAVNGNADKTEEKLEERIRKLEENIAALIDESCIANKKKEYLLSLDKAKEASKKEKALIRLLAEAGQPDSHNLDLTFMVLFNMAVQYEANDMYSEALNTYNIMFRNNMFPNSNELKINMGNIYAHLGQISKAIKIYRMTLDQIPNTQKDMRVKITHNIGLLLVRLGQYHDASVSFEYIMQEKPDFRTGLHTVLCYYAMGDKDKMKESFKKMLEIQLDIDEEVYQSLEDDPEYNLLLEVIRNDKLRQFEKDKIRQAEHCVLTAAKLIAPIIDISFSAGYNWCIETIKNSSHSSLAGDLEMNKAIMYLKQREIKPAIETLKSLEKKDNKLAGVSCNNMSFVFFKQGEIEEAEKYADKAREADVYAPSPYINLGNCFFIRGEYEKAKNFYEIALNNDISSSEALYNLGLLYKKCEEYEESLKCFLKLQAVVNNHPPVLYQLANVHQCLGDIDQAVDWYLQLLSIVPTDASVFLRLGEIYDNDNDKQQAFHYYYEAYRYSPDKTKVLDWLGTYYVQHRVAEKAIPFYEKAALLQPHQPKWPLLVGSCLRRAGNYHQALQVYKQTHTKFPDNIDCLKFLVRLSSDLGLKETAEYAHELKRIEKSKEVKDRVGSSRSSGSRKSSGRSTVNSPSSPAATPIRKHLAGDGSYRDPLGPGPERPRTGGFAPPKTPFRSDEDFSDDILSDQLLPE